MDCTESGKDTCNKFDVKGFPTLKWFSDANSEAEEYSGGRQAADLVKFVRDKVGDEVFDLAHVQLHLAFSLPQKDAQLLSTNPLGRKLRRSRLQHFQSETTQEDLARPRAGLLRLLREEGFRQKS